MLMPKKTKHRKHHRGRLKGASKGATEVSYGEYGIKALEPGESCSCEVGQLARERAIAHRKVDDVASKVADDGY